MITTPRNPSLSTIMLLMLGLSACTTTDTALLEPQVTSPAQDVSYEVKSGDRLSHIATKLTGSAENWRLIATRNGITNPRKLAAGDIILIPYKLLEQNYSINSSTQDTVTVESAPLTAHSTAPLPVTTGTGFSVARGRDTSKDESAAIKVSAVEVNRSFSLQPLEKRDFSMTEDRMADSLTLQIRVVGTYYPKGIYAEPADYARLVRRVAPGTTFYLQSRVNNWYKIVTDQGIGYLRQSDGALVK